MGLTLSPSINPAVIQAALQEDERHRKTEIFCLKMSPNQSNALRAYANYSGTDVQVIIRRIVREWLVSKNT